MDRYAKAIVGALVAGLGTLRIVHEGGVTTDEWIEVAATTLAALGLVWGVPNAEDEAYEETTEPYNPQH